MLLSLSQQIPEQEGSEVCFGAEFFLFFFSGREDLLSGQFSPIFVHKENNLSNLRAQKSIFGGDVQESVCT